jgi:hypothetical protein
VKTHPTSTGTGIALRLNYASLQPPSSLLSDSDMCDTSQLIARRAINSSPSKAMFVDSTRIVTAPKPSRKRSLSHLQRASPLIHPPPPFADLYPIAIHLFNEFLSHFFRTWPSRQSTSSPRLVPLSTVAPFGPHNGASASFTNSHGWSSLAADLRMTSWTVFSTLRCALISRSSRRCEREGVRRTGREIRVSDVIKMMLRLMLWGGEREGARKGRR